MKKQKLPAGWTHKKIASLAATYESQSEADALAEDEALLAKAKSTLVEVPVELVPRVRKLIARHKAQRKE